MLLLRTIPWSVSVCCTVGCLLSTPSSPLYHLLPRNSAPSKKETISRKTLIKVRKPTPYLELLLGQGRPPCPHALTALPSKYPVLKLVWTVVYTHPVLRSAPKLDSVSTALLSDNSHVTFPEKSWHFCRRTHMILTSRVADQHLQTKTFICQCRRGIQATGHIRVMSKFSRGKQWHIDFPLLV